MGAMLLCGTLSFAQSDDPVIMTINGHPVLRSEFAYSYKKNNTNGVLDRKSVRDYVPLFVNYKLKVEAARMHISTRCRLIKRSLPVIATSRSVRQ